MNALRGGALAHLDRSASNTLPSSVCLKLSNGEVAENPIVDPTWDPDSHFRCRVRGASWPVRRVNSNAVVNALVVAFFVSPVVFNQNRIESQSGGKSNKTKKNEMK